MGGGTGGARPAGGAFGEVYKATLKGVNPVAVKVLRDQSYTSREDFSREVALLKALHNSNIVQFQVGRPPSAGAAAPLPPLLLPSLLFRVAASSGGGAPSVLHVAGCWSGYDCRV